MQQNSSTRISNKTEEMGPTSFDEAWKAVGSHSRRGSLATPGTMINGTTCDNQSPAASPVPAQRRSSLDPTQWGFQWDGGIFDNETRKPSFSHLPPTIDDSSYALHRRSFSFAHDNNILSVPMLPGVSTEPIYRQQRSLSFSVGQDPTFFGYDDYQDEASRYGSNDPASLYGYKNSLATMEEEQDDEDDMLQDRINQELSAARTRSQSSGAVFGLLTQQNDSLRQLRRGSEHHDQPRRSSRFFGDGSTTPLPMVDTLPLRRLPQSHGREYKFPDQTYNLLQQRRQSLTHPHHIQQLSEQLENTSLYPSDPPQRTTPPDIKYRQPSNVGGYGYISQQSHIIPQQEDTDRYSTNTTSNNVFQDTGKGIPLQRLPKHIPLYAVEFKASRMEYFYVVSEPRAPGIRFQVGDLVIVEGDRGKDLGKVASDTLSIAMVEQHVSRQQQEDVNGEDKPKDTYIKRLYRLGTLDENNLLVEKEKDERKALEYCQQKTKMRQLPMAVVDAEYQWDRRKLTFFFVSDRRIDFRELVRELFKHYKTRIWMCAVNPS